MDKIKKTNSLSFGGTVFMYGNRCIVVEKKGDKVIITDWVGNDGVSEKNNEIESNVDGFNKFIEEFDISFINCVESDQDNVFVAVEDEEPTGAYEWWISMYDEEDDELVRICGKNPKSSAFVKISQLLKDSYEEFDVVEGFFDSVNN